MAFGSVSESDFKTAVTLRISELWDVVDRRAALFVLLLRFLWRKLCSQISFTSHSSSCRRMSEPQWQHRQTLFLWMFSHVALCFTQKKSIRTASLNVCLNKLDDPVHASWTVACLVKPGSVYFVWSYHVCENLWIVLCTFDMNIYQRKVIHKLTCKHMYHSSSLFATEQP